MIPYSNQNNLEHNVVDGMIEFSQPLGEGNRYPELKHYDLKAYKGAGVKLHAFSTTVDGDGWSALRPGDLSPEYSRWLRRQVSLGTSLGVVHKPGIKARPFPRVTEKLQATKKLRFFPACTPRLGKKKYHNKLTHRKKTHGLVLY
jgi:hypothetical protein